MLVADRDRELVHLVTHTLRRAGLGFAAAHDHASALELFMTVRPAVVVLDIDGIDLLKRFRQDSHEAAIIGVTRATTIDARVSALESGADHLVSKPFSHRELVARIRACLRRDHTRALSGDGWALSPLEVGDLVLDVDQHLATLAGQPIHFTRLEFRVLRYLMLRVGTIVPVGALLNEFWHSENIKSKNAMRVTVHRIRRKLQRTALLPPVLEAIPGVGFRMNRGVRG
ncbi:MAG: MtrAB system response regulator MtrA [Chloroflexota bacterium]